ncbi:hypothetical protein LSH36_169g02012 [Paralvinella palmiformis]|uniref:G2/mitotic-specific cyclin-B3 n=1 Tax=Paralvinella palmiformis TaxID=53620 RepID=A0AAD9JSL9_9ANNE|nr:hypothetical protein LSH36_169g02012 [Paralvinella palmiformis]
MASRRNTRSRKQNENTLINTSIGGSKRAREPDNDGDQKKKRVFGDLTNQENSISEVQKKALKRIPVLKKTKVKKANRPKPNQIVKENEEVSTCPDDTLSSQNSVKSVDVSLGSLDTSNDSLISQNSNVADKEEEFLKDLVISDEARKLLKESNEKLDDIDKENLNDPYQCAVYAPYIFNYYKTREIKFPLTDYMSWQEDLVPHMRGILVDWLVEVQENFELNHETLYLAIKLVDLYLNKNKTTKDRLQLVGATALFIACKFDERCPPMLDDFLYICDDAYKSSEVIEMERNILKSVDFDLGIPLSYRFLRRYSKCARTSIVTLTLSRYILETSQMDYSFIQMKDSFRAAAALLLAMKMDASGQWTNTMVYYTGYTESELLPLVLQFNKMIMAQPKSKLSTIRKKYSHRIFHEVALIPPLNIVDVFQPEVTDSPSSAS